MIKQFKKLLVLFLLIGSHQLIYSQDIPNTGVSLNSSTLQGRCAPIDISVSVTWPEDNNSTTEYIFILHDEGDSNPLSSSIYQTHSFFTVIVYLSLSYFHSTPLHVMPITQVM